ncbi:hypothetical protein Tco_1067484 [Tanacetum coccineum]|uniref:Uncharacterized protein n=1 Tax=Tanacetum coccineum TaxID=301880 RepID=A0ABQ5HEP1_9ASTR
MGGLGRSQDIDNLGDRLGNLKIYTVWLVEQVCVVEINEDNKGIQRGIILLILGGFAWCYTHAYIEDGVTFIAKSSVTFLAKRSMFEISGNNFNDWFRQLKMVLRVERKLFVIEQPISLASPTDSEYLRSGMRMRENQLAHMSLDEELCGTGTSWLCAPTRA